MAKIDSEAVDRIDYNAPSETLFVRFTGGEWYAYLNVPQDVAAAFLAAPSHGRFFQAHVRDRYAFQRIEL